MKLDLVWGILPMIIFECDTVKGEKRTSNSFLCVSFVEDINDSIQVAHERAIVKFNYMVTFLSLVIMALSMAVSFYVFLIMVVIYLPTLIILYGTDVGEYHRDVKAYAASALEFSKKYSVNIDTSIEHYTRVILESKKYGTFARKLGEERIVKDLKKHIEMS